MDWPSGTDTLLGIPIVPWFVTVTLLVAFGMLGNKLAVIVAAPAPVAVTGIVVVLEFAANVTVEGTVATAVLLEMTLIVTPPVGARAVRVAVIFDVIGPVMLKVEESVTVAVTVLAAEVVAVNPGADAVIVADPMLTPVNLGATEAWVAPAGMTKVAGTLIAGLLLVRVTVTPAVGAATGILIA